MLGLQKYLTRISPQEGETIREEECKSLSSATQRKICKVQLEFWKDTSITIFKELSSEFSPFGVEKESIHKTKNGQRMELFGPRGDCRALYTVQGAAEGLQPPLWLLWSEAANNV